MERKVGDKVRIRSKEWYEQNKDEEGWVEIGPSFSSHMSVYCSRIATITKVDADGTYLLDIDPTYWWSDEMFEETLYLPGDKVKMKSREWFEANKNEEGEIHEGDYFIDDRVAECILGKVVTIKEAKNPGYTINPRNYVVFDDWIEDLVESSENGIEIGPELVLADIVPGSPVVVCDRYHEDGPREDWTFATFVRARVKGVDTEHGIWNYCMSLSAFVLYYNTDWKKCLENTYTGKDKQLIKINER